MPIRDIPRSSPSLPSVGTFPRVGCRAGLFLAAWFAGGLQGCSMFRATIENLVDAPLHYHRVGDDHETCCLHERLARRAWREHQAGNPECQTASRDFADGFKAGFVDQLTYGGPPLPPVVPHRRYWNVIRRNSDDNAAARDWLAGFELGARQAFSSGIREAAMLPANASLPDPNFAGPTSADGFTAAPSGPPSETAPESVPAPPTDIQLPPLPVTDPLPTPDSTDSASLLPSAGAP